MQDAAAVGSAKQDDGTLTGLVVRRSRIVLALMFLAGTGFLTLELITAPLLGPHTVVKVFGLMTIASALLLLRSRRIQAHARLFSVLIMSTGYIGTAISGILSPSHEYATSAIVFLVAALVSATLLPWGAWAQLATVVIAAASLGTSVWFADGDLDVLVTDPGAAVVLALASSVVIASEVRRNRTENARLQAMRDQAETEVRALNATLERRVVERTAELALVNQRLQQESEERQRAANALLETQQRLVDVLDHSNAVVSLKDVEGRYILVNREFERVLGIGRKQAEGRTDEELFGPEMAEELGRRDQRVLEVDAPISFAFEMPRLGSRWTHFISVKFPLRGPDGQRYGIGTIWTDITRVKEAEEKARRRQDELARVQRLHLVNEMAAALAHEIHQPLGAIANYAQAGSQWLRAGNGDPVELLRICDKIANESLRAGGILRGLRRLVSKRGTAMEVVDLNGVIADAAMMLQLQAREHHVELEIDASMERARVVGDKTQLEQVLVNLIVNAIDAASDGHNGERRVDVSATITGHEVAVNVRDSGPGIAAEDAAKLFTPFFTTKSNGLGMGLAISRSIVEAHGGSLAPANVSHGCVFRLTLPLVTAPTAQALPLVDSYQVETTARRAIVKH